jgi:DNA-binding MarR family transcriptional regulator
MENFSSFAISLENINKCINKIKSIKISEFGIRSAHFNCMMHIDLSSEGLTPTELSKDCGVDKAFVSRTTADLVKGGFIQTNKKFDDGRKYRNKYVLTEKGKEVIKETKTMIEKYFTELGEKIGEYEIKCFWRVVIAISDVLNKNLNELDFRKEY